jgi:hypothetical protein
MPRDQQACSQEPLHLFIDRRKKSHGVCVALHLLEVGHNHHTCLLGVGQLLGHLHDLGTVLRGEHDMQLRPHNFNYGVLGHLAQHVFIHGSDHSE